ncbi:MAG TPA: phosphoribosyltransferase family protein [Burkholderiaceae bacterium]|nr:phosphoribosyltransferase family protein [Burkholderiaceae bacterium]
MSGFADRTDAGRQLAQALVEMKLVDPVVLALPRGGVPVGVEVAAALHAPLDVVLVRKIGAPGHRELAVAAVAEGPDDDLVLDAETMAATGATRAYVEHEATRERAENARRRAAYLGGRAALPIEGKTVVVVDDGIATGTSVRAALQALRARRPARLVLAVPVAPPGAVAELEPLVDDLVCLSQPSYFYAVGAHYADFRQVSDDEVIAALETAHAARRRAADRSA